MLTYASHPRAGRAHHTYRAGSNDCMRGFITGFKRFLRIASACTRSVQNVSALGSVVGAALTLSARNVSSLSDRSSASAFSLLACGRGVMHIMHMTRVMRMRGLQCVHCEPWGHEQAQTNDGLGM